MRRIRGQGKGGQHKVSHEDIRQALMYTMQVCLFLQTLLFLEVVVLLVPWGAQSPFDQDHGLMRLQNLDVLAGRWANAIPQ